MLGYFAQLWAVLMSLGFVPAYIKLLGIDLYGIIGIYAAVQAIFAILDIGITNSLTRELSRLLPCKSFLRMRDTIRMNEVVGLMIFVFALLSTFLPFFQLAPRLEASAGLSGQELWLVFFLCILLIGFRAFENIYRQALVGLQKIGIINIALAVTATIKGFGSFLVLKYLSATLPAYFVSQLIASLLTVCALGVILYKSLPLSASRRARPSLKIFLETSAFSASITAVMALTTLLLQSDRLILPLKLSLEEFGYYSFAATLAAGIFYLTTPIATVTFPRFCALASSANRLKSIKLFSTVSQLVSVILSPIALVLCLQSFEILSAWTGSSLLAANAAPIFSLLLFANFLFSLGYIPSQLQFAYGLTTPWLCVLVIQCILYIPAIFVLAPYFFGVGVAALWLIVNSLVVVLAVPLTISRLRLVNTSLWITKDVLLPAFFSAASAYFAMQLLIVLFGPSESVVPLVSGLLISIVFGFLGGICLSSELRALLLRRDSS